MLSRAFSSWADVSGFFDGDGGAGGVGGRGVDDAGVDDEGVDGDADGGDPDVDAADDPDGLGPPGVMVPEAEVAGLVPAGGEPPPQATSEDVAEATTSAIAPTRPLLHIIEKNVLIRLAEHGKPALGTADSPC